jgi:DivIVA domain-containing protein
VSITPADIEAQRFPVVFRGYKVEAVDAFLDRLQADLAEMLADRVGEQAPTDPAADAADESREPGPDEPTASDADRLGGGGAGHAARALRTLVRAEQMAEQVMAEATGEAEETRARAQVEAGNIIAAARAESGRIEAERNLRHQREVGALAVQAQQLRAEIDRLSNLERQYYAGLAASLAEHQQLLEQRVPVLDTAAATAPASPDDDLQPAA